MKLFIFGANQRDPKKLKWTHFWIFFRFHRRVIEKKSGRWLIVLVSFSKQIRQILEIDICHTKENSFVDGWGFIDKASLMINSFHGRKNCFTIKTEKLFSCR